MSSTSSIVIVMTDEKEEEEEEATSTQPTAIAAHAGACCHGDGRRSPQQLHGAVGDQRRTVAAAGRSARIREDWIGGDDGRS